MRASYQAMNPFMTSAEADRMLRIAEERGVFRTYAEEALNDGIGESLPQRFDAAFNYIQHGIDGLGNSDDVTTAAQRTNYFRETYAYGTDIQAPGVEPFFTHPDLLRVASEVTGRALIVPAIVYANILTLGRNWQFTQTYRSSAVRIESACPSGCLSPCFIQGSLMTIESQ